MNTTVMSGISWKKLELIFICFYAIGFYLTLVGKSLRLSDEYSRRLRGLHAGAVIGQGRLNDLSDPQWRNFRGNLPVLTIVMAAFLILITVCRHFFRIRGKGLSFVWLLLSLAYLLYLHGACVGFILAIASINYLIVKYFIRSRYCIALVWSFNIAVLILNRVYDGYSFSLFGQQLAFLDNYRGAFRWHICFNLVVLRMICFGCDFHWSVVRSHFDSEKHMQRCSICSSSKTCYFALQEKGLQIEKYSYITYLCYLIYAPLYISGPILSFNAFAAQIDIPQNNYSFWQICLYGLRWLASFILMEMMTHFLYYNSFVVSGLWWQLSPLEIFIISYGVLNFMWLKFFLIWRYFRFWSLIGGIEAPENMPRCINNCYDLESFWRSWHASFNKWIIRYMYIPLGGSGRKLLNIWVIFTFVAIWHDLEWKLISWAWLTCIFLVPEIMAKSLLSASQANSALGMFVRRELSALAGTVTISCLMVANLVGYVVGLSGVKQLTLRMLQNNAQPVLAVIFFSFYVGVKLMFHIDEAKRRGSRT